MQFKGTCIAVEDSSYQSKRSGRVGQMTLTCLDADTVLRQKENFVVILWARSVPRAFSGNYGAKFAKILQIGENLSLDRH